MPSSISFARSLGFIGYQIWPFPSSSLTLQMMSYNTAWLESTSSKFVWDFCGDIPCIRLPLVFGKGDSFHLWQPHLPNVDFILWVWPCWARFWSSIPRLVRTCNSLKLFFPFSSRQFVIIKFSEQCTETSLSTYSIIRPASSDHTDLIRDLTRWTKI